MVHDARIIRMGGEHLPPHVRKWMGDSVGHWEGDTLVVDTTNFTGKTQFQRFDRTAARRRALHARGREDAALSIHRGRSADVGPRVDRRVSMGRAPNEQLYEYACHEGNYSLGDMLRGARQAELENAQQKKK